MMAIIQKTALRIGITVAQGVRTVQVVVVVLGG
jgi:hypothetical protein